MQHVHISTHKSGHTLDHIAQYNSTLTALLSTHTPVKSKTIIERADSKWYITTLLHEEGVQETRKEVQLIKTEH